MKNQNTIFTFFSVSSVFSVAKIKSVKSGINFPLCLGVFVAEIQSIETTKLCKTNPISKKPEINLTPCSTITNNKKL
jgi:hypothetical protein